MNMKNVKMTRINITIEEDVLKDFKEYCVRQNRSVSAQLAYLAKQAMKDEGPH